MIRTVAILGLLTLVGCGTATRPLTDFNSAQPLPEPQPEMDDTDLSVYTGTPGSLFSKPFDPLDYGIEEAPRVRNYSLSEDLSRTNPNDTALTVSDKNRFIVVNIPAQTLRAFENGQEIVRSKLILGKTTTRTPTQISRITSLKLNPDWHAPAGGGIERAYTARLRKGEADELRAIHIDWYKRPNGTYQFYQKPGPNNVLGRIKFEMYSPSNTYLHDTNRRDLFNLSERFISFGCIRVQKWDELAAWMLNTPVSDFREYIAFNEYMHRKNIDPVEIHIVYWTEEIVDGQQVQWPDYYNRN